MTLLYPRQKKKIPSEMRCVLEFVFDGKVDLSLQKRCPPSKVVRCLFGKSTETGSFEECSASHHVTTIVHGI
jgi:hypothetical protein